MAQKETWTPDQRKQWADTWSQPHMQAGLAEIERRTRVNSTPLPPGYDALVLSACEHHRSVGHREILNHIETMGDEKFIPSPLPAPFTREARGEKPPQEQK
jgi:hypothetical protein